MKKVIQFSWINVLFGVALCSLLLSFSARPGAHSVQVYLDSKLVLDQYITSRSEPPKILLNLSENYENLIVRYSECGRTVTGRKITVKNDKDEVLKQWTFEGASSGFKEPMTCAVKELASFRQKGSNTLKLYYSSNEFPEGHQIAFIAVSGEAKTALNK